MEIRKAYTSSDGTYNMDLFTKKDDFVIDVNWNIHLHVIRNPKTGKVNIYFTTYSDVDKVTVSYSGKETRIETIDYEKEVNRK